MIKVTYLYRVNAYARVCQSVLAILRYKLKQLFFTILWCVYSMCVHCWSNQTIFVHVTTYVKTTFCDFFFRLFYLKLIFFLLFFCFFSFHVLSKRLFLLRYFYRMCMCVNQCECLFIWYDLYRFERKRIVFSRIVRKLIIISLILLLVRHIICVWSCTSPLPQFFANSDKNCTFFIANIILECRFNCVYGFHRNCTNFSRIVKNYISPVSNQSLDLAKKFFSWIMKKKNGFNCTTNHMFRLYWH